MFKTLSVWLFRSAFSQVFMSFALTFAQCCYTCTALQDDVKEASFVFSSQRCMNMQVTPDKHRTPRSSRFSIVFMPSKASNLSLPEWGEVGTSKGVQWNDIFITCTIHTEYVTEIIAWYALRHLALICVGFDWLAYLGCWDSIWPLKTFRDITGSLGSTTLIRLAFSSWWMIPSVSSSDFRRLNTTVHIRGWGQRQPKGGTLFSRGRSWVSYP